MTRKVSNCELSPSAGSGSAALKGALKRCQVVARAEYRVVSDAAEQTHQVCDEILGQLSKKRIKPRKGEKGKRLNSAVGTLAAEVEGQLIPLVAGAEKRLRAQYRQLSRFTVGLFGSTMAGKSTLREAVTGGDGSTIGKGAQNTTRRLQEYTWSGLRIVDTPGFGAHDSKAFTNQALRVLDKSDLVLFLCNSGLGIQESDFKMMAELVWENKPVVFVLNVKRDLEDDFHRRRFVKSPEGVMNEREIRRHISRIRTLAMEWRAQPEPTIIPIHAQAAHLATLPKYSAESGKLHACSRIDELQEYLAGEVIGHGEIRRVMMVVDGMAGSMDGISTLLDESIRGFGVASKFVHGQAKGFDKRCARFCTDRKREIADRCQDAFTVLKRRAANFVEDNIEKKNIEHRWKRMVSSCRSSLGLKNFQNS